jgi:hypothetical protein
MAAYTPSELFASNAPCYVLPVIETARGVQHGLPGGGEPGYEMWLLKIL